MDKRTFLARLRDALSGLPRDDIEERLAFYEEMIDDRMEDGLSEEEAVAAVGSVEETASQIAADIPLGRIVAEKMKPRRRLRGWEIALMILGFPVWFPLLVAGAAVLFSLFVSLWAVVLSLWVVHLSVTVSALACLAAGILFIVRGMTASGLFLIAGSLVLAGLSVLLYFVCRAATRGTAVLGMKTGRWIRSLFIRKEKADETR